MGLAMRERKSVTKETREKHGRARKSVQHKDGSAFPLGGTDPPSGWMGLDGRRSLS